MLAANYSLWPDNGRTPPDLFSAVMIFTPIKTMMMMYRKEIEGEKKGKFVLSTT